MNLVSAVLVTSLFFLSFLGITRITTKGTCSLFYTAKAVALITLALTEKGPSWTTNCRKTIHVKELKRTRHLKKIGHE